MKPFIFVCFLTLLSSLSFAKSYTLITTEPPKVADGEKSAEKFFIEIVSEVFTRSGLKLSVEKIEYLCLGI